MEQEAELMRMMQAYGVMLSGLCAALLKDRDLAQDMVQETFVKAWRKMDDLKGGRQSEKAWLCRIAINLCRDYQRTRWFRLTQRRAEVDAAPMWYTAPDEAAQDVMDALGSLNARMREVLVLHYLHDMDASEMGRALGISKSAVYRRLKKARSLLKQTLEGWEHDE